MAHRPGVALPDQMRDRDAARRGGVPVTRDHDQDPTYSSEEACWPEGSMDDPGRFDGDPCYGLALDDFLVTYTCRGCHASFYGSSEAAVRTQVLAHQGRT